MVTKNSSPAYRQAGFANVTCLFRERDAFRGYGRLGQATRRTRIFSVNKTAPDGSAGPPTPKASENRSPACLACVSHGGQGFRRWRS